MDMITSCHVMNTGTAVIRDTALFKQKSLWEDCIHISSFFTCRRGLFCIINMQWKDYFSPCSCVLFIVFLVNAGFYCMALFCDGAHWEKLFLAIQTDFFVSCSSDICSAHSPKCFLKLKQSSFLWTDLYSIERSPVEHFTWAKYISRY